MREGELKIILALGDGPKSFTDLKELMSPPSLSENLKRLLNRGLIVKNEDTRMYSLPDVWGRQKGERVSLKKNLRLNFADVPYWSSTINILDRMDLIGFDVDLEGFDKNEAIEDYVTTVISNLWDNIFCIIYVSKRDKDPDLIKNYVENYIIPTLHQIAELIDIDETFSSNSAISEAYLRAFLEINEVASRKREQFLEMMKPLVEKLE